MSPAHTRQKWYSTRTIGVFANEPGTECGLPNLLRQYWYSTPARNVFLPISAFVNVLVASPHATCFSSAGSIRSGLSQTLSAKLQFRVDPDQRSGVLAFASA